MDELNIKELERIPIPEGLEERLEAKIDEWARPTLTEKHAHKPCHLLVVTDASSGEVWDSLPPSSSSVESDCTWLSHHRTKGALTHTMTLRLPAWKRRRPYNC